MLFVSVPSQRAETSAISVLDVVRLYGSLYPIGRQKQPLISPYKIDLGRPTEKDNVQQWRDNPACYGFGLNIKSPSLVVFDSENKFKEGIDRPGEDGIANFQQFWQSHVDSLPETLTIQSASDGLHVYFLLPPDLMPEGKYLTGKPIAGIDLLTYGRNAILPGSRAEVSFGSGMYRVIAGHEAGIVEMPRPLALALRDMTILEDIANLGKKRTKKRPPRRPSGSSAPSFTTEALDKPSEADVAAAVARMSQKNKYFGGLWSAELVP